ncbi:hypothetical protein [Filimonas effusa]|uniref:SGNH/GDSL hydrolase family protein n=1 Tax=Filimonas effusa TaxID=2508721 RepID=A0A4Q1D332_9BACT|nr:hypothetical protein [Filimonas effusa]RXK81812.1 hypothetical protein ESB13_18650 [Filimonas effusa]
MKRFFIKLFVLLAITFSLFWVLDLAFTYVFKKGYYTKIQWLATVKDQHFNYAMHGSSRAFTTIDVPMIDSARKIKGINISVDGSSIPDQYIMLKLFLKNGNTIDKLFLQIDPFSSNTEDIFDFAIPKFLPYLKDSAIFNHFKQFGPEWYAFRYIPFYRYAKYNTLWGAHEVLIDQFHLLPTDFDQYGDYFYPEVNYKGPEKLRDLTFDLNGKYKFLNQIISLCDEHKIKLILFTAPVADIIIDSAYKKNIAAFTSMMKAKGVDYYNYGDLYGHDPKFFYNEIHITRKGAEDFTRQMLADGRF